VIPFATLDPASLAMWLDTSIVTIHPAGREIGTALARELLGERQEAIRACQQIERPEDRARAFYLLSCVWHEKRHFLDLVLTNAGARRFREYVQIYANLAPVINEFIKDGKPVPCPLDVILDDVRSAVMGVDGAGPSARALAGAVQRVREGLDLEDKTIANGGRQYTVGADAQFESLAHTMQWAAMQDIAGPDALVLARKQFGDSVFSNRRYRWFEELLHPKGLVPTKEIAPGAHVADMTLQGPLLMASLAVRRFRPEAKGGKVEFGWAASRFVLIVQWLVEHRIRLDFYQLTIADAWALVNKACGELFGSDVFTEIEEDYAGQERLFSSVWNEPTVPDYVKAIIRDYHALRRRLIDHFKADPVSVLDPGTFVKRLLPRLDPMPILARPHGELGEPEAPMQRLMGYVDPGPPTPESRWWWAAFPSTWPPVAPGQFSFRDKDAWATCVNELAPLAKMLLGGRDFKHGMGIELGFSEQRLAAGDVHLTVEAAHRFPRQVDEIASYWQLAGTDSAVCDFCRSRIPRPTGHCLTPWLFRISTENFKLMQRMYGDGERGRLKALRDWSWWVVCDACFGRFVRDYAVGA
jgi:hypothetical protein